MSWGSPPLHQLGGYDHTVFKAASPSQAMSETQNLTLDLDCKV